jgi:hypothetical protein
MMGVIFPGERIRNYVGYNTVYACAIHTYSTLQITTQLFIHDNKQACNTD